MKVTRIIHSVDLNQGKYDALNEQARLLGDVRSEIWQRFGCVNGVGENHRTIRSDWVKSHDFSPLPAKAWKETLRDALDDIKLYEAAAKEKVRKQIHNRFESDDDRKKYFGLLKYDKWITNPLLCRWMREAKKHGVNHTYNQIVVEAGVYSQFHGKDGNTWLKIPSLVKGKRIAIPLNSNILLRGTLRLILKDGAVEVHYYIERKCAKPCGDMVMGVDKGYTEVFADSLGDFHGKGFNELLTPASDSRKKKGQKRNKLYQIAMKSSPEKRDRIFKNNLGAKTKDRKNNKIKQQIRNHCFQAAHSVVDKANVVVLEDLTSPIPKQNNWKQFNRRMNGWMKGSITEAIETVTKARGSSLHYVNAAYTSQMDSNTRHLQGARVGDKFHHVNGDVGQADINAARNIEHRFYDDEIERYMPYQKVKRILLDRLRASEELAGATPVTVPSGL